MGSPTRGGGLQLAQSQGKTAACAFAYQLARRWEARPLLESYVWAPNLREGIAEASWQDLGAGEDLLSPKAAFRLPLPSLLARGTELILALRGAPRVRRALLEARGRRQDKRLTGGQRALHLDWQGSDLFLEAHTVSRTRGAAAELWLRSCSCWGSPRSRCVCIRAHRGAPVYAPRKTFCPHKPTHPLEACEGPAVALDMAALGSRVRRRCARPPCSGCPAARPWGPRVTPEPPPETSVKHTSSYFTVI